MKFNFPIIQISRVRIIFLYSGNINVLVLIQKIQRSPQIYYNYQRSHSSLNGKIPTQAADEKSAAAPFWEDVVAKYDPNKERIREQVYERDKKMALAKKKAKSYFYTIFPSLLAYCCNVSMEPLATRPKKYLYTQALYHKF